MTDELGHNFHQIYDISLSIHKRESEVLCLALSLALSDSLWICSQGPCSASSAGALYPGLGFRLNIGLETPIHKYEHKKFTKTKTEKIIVLIATTALVCAISMYIASMHQTEKYKQYIYLPHFFQQESPHNDPSSLAVLWLKVVENIRSATCFSDAVIFLSKNCPSLSLLVLAPHIFAPLSWPSATFPHLRYMQLQMVIMQIAPFM